MSMWMSEEVRMLVGPGKWIPMGPKVPGGLMLTLYWDFFGGSCFAGKVC